MRTPIIAVCAGHARCCVAPAQASPRVAKTGAVPAGGTTDARPNHDGQLSAGRRSCVPSRQTTVGGFASCTAVEDLGPRRNASGRECPRRTRASSVADTRAARETRTPGSPVARACSPNGRWRPAAGCTGSASTLPRSRSSHAPPPRRLRAPWAASLGEARVRITLPKRAGDDALPLRRKVAVTDPGAVRGASLAELRACGRFSWPGARAVRDGSSARSTSARTRSAMRSGRTRHLQLRHASQAPLNANAPHVYAVERDPKQGG
jgi:hypothetical protein